MSSRTIIEAVLKSRSQFIIWWNEQLLPKPTLICHCTISDTNYRPWVLTIRYFGCATEQFNDNSSMLVEPTNTRKYRASISHSWMWWLGMLGEPNVSRWLVYTIPLNFMSLSNAYCLAWPNSSKLLHMHINCRTYQRKLISSSIYFKFPRNLLNSRIWRSKFMRHCLLCSPLNIRD